MIGSYKSFEILTGRNSIHSGFLRSWKTCPEFFLGGGVEGLNRGVLSAEDEVKWWGEEELKGIENYKVYIISIKRNIQEVKG